MENIQPSEVHREVLLPPTTTTKFDKLKSYLRD